MCLCVYVCIYIDIGTCMYTDNHICATCKCICVYMHIYCVHVCVSLESSSGHITVLFLSIVAVMSLPLVQHVSDNSDIITSLPTQLGPRACSENV